MVRSCCFVLILYTVSCQRFKNSVHPGHMTGNQQQSIMQSKTSIGQNKQFKLKYLVNEAPTKKFKGTSITVLKALAHCIIIKHCVLYLHRINLK